MSTLSSRSSGGGGGLRICGCLWRIASDDLVVPAWLEFFFRLIGIVVIVSVLIFEEIVNTSSSTCAAENHLDVYLIVAAVLFSLQLGNALFLALESARGAIWDENKKSRKWVEPLLYGNIVLTVGEFLWALTGSVWVVRGFMANCMKTPNIATDYPLYAITGVIVATWVGLALKVLVSALSFNACGERNADNNELFVVSDSSNRPSFLSRLLSLCMKKSQINFFTDVSNVLAEVFDDESFVPTDIASALLLLYARQRLTPELLVVSEEEEGEVLQPSFTPLSEAFDQEITSSGDHTSEQQRWDDPDMVTHFMDYAGAAYGYTWFLMRSTCLNFYRMYPHTRFFACLDCCCPCRQEEGLIIEADNCLNCNTAALRVMLPYLEDESIVHISFKNKLMEVPYFVALDHTHKKIVVSIRGTLSLEDTLTDLCAKPESMGLMSECDYLAHGGMVKAAQYVHEELRQKNILNNAFSYYDSYQLVVTGHSLGAGTAAILAFMLRQYYPSTKCYAYSPPGGLLNEVAAKASEDFTLSVIVGKDLVPRLSLQSVGLLKEQMKQELRNCRLPKYQILASGLSACCVRDWTANLCEPTVYSNSRRSSSVDSADSSEPILADAPTARYESMELPGDQGDSSTRGCRRAQCVKMFLPGRIWHLEQTADRRFTSSEKTSQDFQEILVSPKMLTDHLPNNVRDALSSLSIKST